MGYFSNGSEGEAYQAHFCANCVHDVNQDCRIWLLHLLHNYDECNKPDSFLHVLIPRSKDKLSNEQCSMFLGKPSTPMFPSHCDRCGLPYHGGACSGHTSCPSQPEKS